MKQDPYQKLKRTENTTKVTHAYNILVVDDEPNFNAILSEILQSFGYIVHQVYSVPHAIELIEEMHPDLILTDIMLPGIDGLTLVRTLRDDPIWSSIPIIAVTAKAHPSEVEATMSAGADTCLIKPFSATDLRNTVKSFLP